MKNMPASAVVAIPTALEVSRALAVNKEEALARQEASLLRSLPVNWAGMAVSKVDLVASRVIVMMMMMMMVSKVDLVASRVSKVDMVARMVVDSVTSRVASAINRVATNRVASA